MVLPIKRYEEQLVWEELRLYVSGISTECDCGLLVFFIRNDLNTRLPTSLSPIMYETSNKSELLQ